MGVEVKGFNKITTIDQAISHVHDGSSLLVGGFGGIGNPPTLINAILEKGVKDLTIICNDTAFPDIGVGRLVSNGRVRKVIASHIGSNPFAGHFMSNGELEVEFCPQGTFVERIRAGGVGLGGILVDIGIDSIVEKDKQTIEIEGRKYLVEMPLTADVAIIHAEKADPFGNVIYDKTALNTSPYVAMAGNLTIVEAEEIVGLGEISPEAVMTPGVFVDLVVQSKGVDWTWVWEERFERRLP